MKINNYNSNTIKFGWWLLKNAQESWNEDGFLYTDA